MTFEDLERAFYKAYPQGSFLATSIGPMTAVKVQFKEGGRVYTYKGSAWDIAGRLKLDRPLAGAPRAQEYECQVNWYRGKWGVEYISVGSPFTGVTLTFVEGLTGELPAGLWDRIREAVEASRRRSGSKRALGTLSLTLEQLKRLKAVYDAHQEELKQVGSKE